ncbi:DUF1738 domain-containing protein [Tenacibaculum finnmarkense]|uniref:ArdC family protein n=1 Tax=Tenacibaculum finnmarkense TaxID=2781243 RepID=UPI001EFAB645|nr:zincin-like metallopeptidase domain-containing protein [Tenacibaculum finnmarkense]MCG8806344.1 DUF1738 domain-containing protein [Tenacibaculum finnmarkense]MCG8857483.1 DUF1738 domain-containing protein [Tenacibaculum finnmarkense]
MVFKKTKIDYYQQITDKVIQYIEENKNTPWVKPWKNISVKNINSFNYSVKPYNPVTGTIYKALNEMSLSMGVAAELLDKDPRFLTFNNIIDAGFRLKKGAEHKPIFFMAPVLVKDTTREILAKEKTTLKDTDKSIETKKLAFTAKEYKVFHASDIIGIPPYEIPKEFKDLQNESVDFQNIKKLLEHNDLKVYSGGNRAFYTKGKDFIQMPFIDQFENKNAFYKTLLHEIGHWTMAEERVYRSIGGSKQEYAKEELVAEMFSLTAAKPFGVMPCFNQSSDYIKGWLSALKNDKQFLFRASSYAERATNYCMELAGLKPILKLEPQIKVDNTIDIDRIKFPFYGKSKEDLKPYFEDLINGRVSKLITNLISPRTNKPFTAKVKLRTQNGEIKVKFSNFLKTEKTIEKRTGKTTNKLKFKRS